MNQGQKVVTRFAPSPTGAAHAGSYRSAIFAWLYARHTGGKFILRIEDTDTARNQEGSADQIIESLTWLGIDYDELYYQSKQVDRHTEIIQELITKDAAYISNEEAKDGSGMKEIVRFRNPGKAVTVHDLIRGDVTIDTSDLGDFVIARTPTEPIFHLANVIDDHDEGVTHVIRAEEHLANTPRQILIFEALGWDIPTYAHLPLVLGPDKLKLSKRRGALAMLEYRNKGYLPDALFNCITFVGWNPGTDQEIFSKEELIALFDLNRVQKAGALFSEEKLDWFNKEYLKKLPFNEQKKGIMEFMPEFIVNMHGFADMIDMLVPLILERIEKFGDVATMAEAGEFTFFFERPAITAEKLIFKGATKEETKEHLEKARHLLEGIVEWELEHIKNLLMGYADTLPKRGPVLHPLRYSLSGLERSPDPFTIAAIIGKEETLARIKTALETL